jgi:hypothetical protein
VKKSPKICPSQFFAKFDTSLAIAPWRNVAEEFGLLLTFSKKTPNENNCPKGENPPNLVTLPPGQSK